MHTQRSTLLTLALACPLLLSTTTHAQNQTSSQYGFQWLTNGLDAIYAGVGSGGNQQAGVDGIGTWIDGQDLRGNFFNQTNGFGYRMSSFNLSVCTTGAPVVEFPALVFTEFDGRNPHRPDVFLKPSCLVGGAPVGMTSGGFIPYGTPPGSSVSFLATGFPSASGLSGSMLVPNNGLLPSSNGGTSRLIGAAAASFPVAPSAACYTFNFTWTPSALRSFDHIDGWWFWATNAEQSGQYWALSTDEQNAFQSETVASDGGLTATRTFMANVDYDLSLISRDPVTHAALAPTSSFGSGIFSNVPGLVGPNPGFDIGSSQAVSLSGLGGARSALTGLATQDPAAAPAGSGVVPSMGFVTFAGNTPHLYTILVQVDWTGVLGAAPETEPNFFVSGDMRLPISQPVVSPAPWIQPVTFQFMTQLIHDPTQFVQGALPYGATAQLSLAGVDPVCALGMPLFLSYGAVGVKPNLTDLYFNSADALVSVSGELLIID